MKTAALNISRIFVGILFIFSGLIKANDPLGFGYKLQEYFEVFHLSFLDGFATGIAIFLCVLEIIFGALLLAGFFSRKVAAGLLYLIIFFTFLTFISAAFKVVTSCGCFGDAIPLTPWQSFSKDLVLLVMIVYIYIHKDLITPVTTNPKVQQIVVFGVLAVSILFSVYTYSFSPILDFLPYKVGASIPELMMTPAGAPADEYLILYKLKNKKTGLQKELSDKDYLKTGIWKDESWEIIGEPVSKLIKKGFEPKVKDLFIKDSLGTDYTKELIENPYYNIVIVAYNLGDTNKKAIAALNAFAINAADQFNIRTILLTSSSFSDAQKFGKKMKLVTEIFYADAVPLKSMVRANPGILLLKNGLIVNKWHFHSMPSFETLKEKYFNNL
jgi:uncharacterized membrane protein YphA (DoxX/SURF4 family)